MLYKKQEKRWPFQEIRATEEAGITCGREKRESASIVKSSGETQLDNPYFDVKSIGYMAVAIARRTGKFNAALHGRSVTKFGSNLKGAKDIELERAGARVRSDAAFTGKTDAAAHAPILCCRGPVSAFVGPRFPHGREDETAESKSVPMDS